jgi:hypothetical protein
VELVYEQRNSESGIYVRVVKFARFAAVTEEFLGEEKKRRRRRLASFHGTKQFAPTFFWLADSF